MTKKRNTALADALKSHPAYIAEREARIAQFIVEAPTCSFLECSDCCYMDRIGEATKPGPFSSFECPECGGALRVLQIVDGESYA